MKSDEVTTSRCEGFTKKQQDFTKSWIITNKTGDFLKAVQTKGL